MMTMGMAVMVAGDGIVKDDEGGRLDKEARLLSLLLSLLLFLPEGVCG